MTTQEIFDTLAENESKLFYAYCADKGNAELKAAHAAARQALEAFAKAATNRTGRGNPPTTRKEIDMANKVKLVADHWYKFNDRGEIHIGYYYGRQRYFECGVCGKGHNAYTFNIWHSSTDYETWGYGKEHLPEILEDLGERTDVIIDEV